eukprot:359279-Hanusia_phi.AAC.6
MDKRLTTCCRCTNWLRRCNRFRNEVKHGLNVNCVKRSYLPVDELIAFSIAPGEVPVPDLRNLKRLFNVIMEKKNVTYKRQKENTSFIFTNYYFKILPLHLQECFNTIFTSKGPFRDIDTADDYCFVNTIVEAWWRYNNYTHIFRHPKTSNLIRKVQKIEDKKMGYKEDCDMDGDKRPNF